MGVAVWLVGAAFDLWTQHLAVLTYSSGLHMLEQTAVSSRSGVSVIDILSKEKK